ncbi:hypothetical protein A4S06_00270 [Erysipelotrichaceae bacterium MTC7]|nr:hypothetical protein A4S06_00270 [Erysipelotrichaceae bacterium MTC7]
MERSYVKTFGFDEHRDLNLLFAGKAECSPLHSYGPAVRPNYIFHVITNGKGVYYLENQRFELESGMGFLIPPEIQTFYQADKDDPWEYYWIAFSGTLASTYMKALGYDMYHPVFHVDQIESIQSIIEEILCIDQILIQDELMLTSHLYHLLSIIKLSDDHTTIAKDQSANPYIQDTINYIKENYATKISISELANSLSLNRSYLSSLFKKEMNVTLQQYITDYRLTRAKELLSLSNFTIEEIAEYSGYLDPLVFSKAFKRKTGVTPSIYRKQEYEKQQEFARTGESLMLNEDAKIMK